MCKYHAFPIIWHPEVGSCCGKSTLAAIYHIDTDFFEGPLPGIFILMVLLRSCSKLDAQCVRAAGGKTVPKTPSRRWASRSSRTTESILKMSMQLKAHGESCGTHLTQLPQLQQKRGDSLIKRSRAAVSWMKKHRRSCFGRLCNNQKDRARECVEADPPGSRNGTEKACACECS